MEGGHRAVRRLLRIGLGGVLLALVLPAGSSAAKPADPPLPPLGEPVPACGSEAAPAGARRPRPAPGAAVSVATYNVLHALGTSNESLDARIPLIVDAIAGSGADVVGAQEVEELGSRGFTTARVARGLAAATGTAWHWCFFAANPVLPGEPDTLVGGGGPGSIAIQPLAGAPIGETVFRTGVGLLSRYPIVESGAHRLGLRVPEEVAACPTLSCQLTAQFESRAAIRGVVRTPRGLVNVVSTHLAHTITSVSELTRIAQTHRLLEWIDGVTATRRYPVLLTGDFNSAEGSAVHQAVAGSGFVDTFRQAWPAADGFTSSQEIDSAVPTVESRIDYVFARGERCTSPRGEGTRGAPRVLGSAVIGDSPEAVATGFLWPSDHYGVVTDVRLVPAAPGTCRPGGPSTVGG